ncbi:hypothetical protein [Mycolicibacterium vanbaalenii]|uniref:hypothetical protein n=1 Tax=Mycolicibacterium vanbaalenii TaxID=110539 RepID=UPI00307F748E
MSSRDRDEDAHGEAPPVPWHNRTSTLLGASLAGMAAIALLVVTISWGTRQFNDPPQAPINYIDSGTSATETRSPTRTTTGTITSTSPPVTTDINPDLTPPSTADTSESPGRNPNYRPPRTREDDADDDSTSRTTRNRPRTNVTRTLNPAP